MTSTLGYYDLMNIAEQNTEQSAKEAAQQKFPSFKPMGKNKKVDSKSAKLSENVKKFLIKQEEEKRQAEEAARLKKQKLLDLRSKDKKATRRVGAMLRMTKSANKAVIADAVHCLNDSLVDQGDAHQPDEDDYGYVSQSADAWHKKMMEKYKAIPKSKPVPRPESHHDVKVPEVKSLKDGKKDYKDTRSTDTPSSSYNGPRLSTFTKEPEKKKAPVKPPMSFTELMAIADEQAKNPEKFPDLYVPTPKKVHQNKDDFEFGRPMTAQEKADYIAEKAMQDKVAKAIKDGTFRTNMPKDSNNNRSSSVKDSPKPTSFKIPSKKQSNEVPSSASTLRTALSCQKSNSTPQRDRQDRTPVIASSRTSSSHVPEKSKTISFSKPEPRGSRSPSSGNKPSKPTEKPTKFDLSRVKTEPGAVKGSPGPSSRSGSVPLNRERENSRGVPNSSFRPSSSNHEREESRPRSPPSKKFKSPNGPEIHRQNENSVRRPAAVDLPRPSPSGTRCAPAKGPPPPPSKAKPVAKGRQVIESDEEYDSEMDDFIDDSDMDPSQISAMIRAITGYDKRKYEHEPDDEPMESSAWEMMREEAKSGRIGLQEDLEDMRKEAEEKKRKAEREKMKRKQRR